VKLYKALSASFGDSSYPLIERILQLRGKKSHATGLNSYAELSLRDEIIYNVEAGLLEELRRR